jgi:hypothetical protein
MPDHKRTCRSLLLTECEEPHSKLTHSVAVERYKERSPAASADHPGSVVTLVTALERSGKLLIKRALQSSRITPMERMPQKRR